MYLIAPSPDSLEGDDSRHMTILDALPAHIAVLDRDGLIVSVNETWRRLACASSLRDGIEGVGRSYLDVCEEATGFAEAGEIAAGVRSILRGETNALSVEYQCHSDPERRWFLLTVRPFSGGAVVMHQALREQIERREQRREIDTRFSGAFEFAPIGVALVSPDGQRFLKVNRALCDLFGYSEEELRTRTIQDLTHPDDVEVGITNVTQALSGGVRSFQLEKRYTHRNGTVIEAMLSASLVRDGNGTPLHFVAHIQDITKRKEAENELRASNERFNQLANNITDAFWIRSPDMQTVQYVSPAFETIWGRPVEYLYTHPHEWADFIVPEDRDRVVSTFAELTGGREKLDLEYRIMRPGGEVRWIRSRGYQVRNAEGELTRNIGIVTDITERKQAEAELRQAQKMDAVGQLAAGVAHEFNNILQTLMSMATISRLNGASRETVRIASVMEEQIRRGASVTRQLLLSSRREALSKMPTDLREQVSSAKELLQRLVPENIRIVLETSQEPAIVEGDAGQIQQVLLNLAINARDAMPDGGTLTLRVVSSENEVSLEVQDDGFGFDDDTRDHLFEPFFTTKKVGEGTGLGLAVVYRIVEQHGGRIEVQSGPGEGSLFRVILPASSGTPVVTQSPDASGMSQGSGLVLLVEDEDGVREGITMLLEMFGYKVIAAGRGEDALALPRTPVPDLLLSDVSLPGISGPALAGQLSTRWPSMKVTLMTGYLEEATRSLARKHGWEVFQKPFEMDELTRHVAEAMRGESPVN